MLDLPRPSLQPHYDARPCWKPVIVVALFFAATVGVDGVGSEITEGTAHHDGPSTYHTHHVRRRPFTYSDYYQPYDPAAAPYLDRILNVSIDAQLDELIKKVSFKKELIFFAFNSRGAWLDWALAMADQLRRVGYQHFFALGEEYCCVKLHRRDPTVPCVYANLPGLQFRRPAATGDNFMDTNPEDLWIVRYRLGSEIMRKGTNVLALDLDCLFRRDVYKDLKSVPLANTTLIHQEEGFANGGLFYIQNALPNGPALWTHDEVWRRAELVAQIRAGRNDDFNANSMDQAFLNDAINSAADPNGSSYDWPSTYHEEMNGKHPFWHDEHKRGEKSRRVQGGDGIHHMYQSMAYWIKDPVDPQWLEGPIQGCNAQGHSCRTPEFRNFIRPVINGDRKAWRRPMVLRVPMDAPERSLPGGDAEELFCAAPFWTFGHTDEAVRDFDISALTHLVGCDAGWHGGKEDWRGGGHAGRRALMAAAGCWPMAQREKVVRKSLDYGATILENPQMARVRYATLSPHLVRPSSGNTIGHDPGAASADAGAGIGAVTTVAGGHAVERPGVSPVRSKNATTELILRFAAASFALNRTPAMFGFPCDDALWINMGEDSRLGVHEDRVIKHGELCYPGVGGVLCNHNEFVYDFELEYSGQPLRTTDSFADAFQLDPEAPVVNLRHLPEHYDPSVVSSEFREACPFYFDVGEDEALWGDNSVGGEEERVVDRRVKAGSHHYGNLGGEGDGEPTTAKEKKRAETDLRVDELLRRWGGDIII